MRMFHTCVLALSTLVVSACSPNLSRPLPQTAEGQLQLNAGYALLYKLMSQESKVSEILTIKSAKPQVELLLVDISQTSKMAVAKLDEFAAADSDLDMKEEHLPAIEVSTRSSIANATAVDLLLPGGGFNELMVMSQFSGMQYGRYLALSIRTADKNIERSNYLRNLATDLSELQDRAFALLAVSATADEINKDDVAPDQQDSAPADKATQDQQGTASNDDKSSDDSSTDDDSSADQTDS